MAMLSPRLISASLVGATTILLGCVAPEMPSTARRMAVTPVPGFPATLRESGFATRERLVVRDAATWATLWPTIARPVPTIIGPLPDPTPPLPEIDFTTSVVVIATMGTRPTGDHEIEIEEVRLDDQHAWIAITESSASKRCLVPQWVTAPIAMVVAPLFTGEATFIEDTETHDCR